MPRGCDYCGKAAVSGNRVSHANNVTKRTWQPNLKSVRAVFEGAAQHVHVCTRCLRSGKVVKATVRAAKA